MTQSLGSEMHVSTETSSDERGSPETLVTRLLTPHARTNLCTGPIYDFATPIS